MASKLRAVFLAIRSAVRISGHFHPVVSTHTSTPWRPVDAGPDAPTTSTVPPMPFELLGAIFKHGTTLSHTHRGRVPACASITHVCRLWRHVAIGSPLLWSNITSNVSKEWAATMVKWSASVPLRMDLRIGAPRLSSDDAASLLSEAHRIHDLRLSGRVSELKPLVEGLGPMENLRALKLFPRSEDDVSTLALPDAVFHGNAPRLKMLHIPLDTATKAPQWMFSNVSQFSTTLSDDPAPNLILNVLGQMPGLEELTLRSCVSPEHWADLLTGGPFRLTLTELRVLEIQEDVGYLGLSAFLLERLDLPFSTRIRMSMATTDLPSNATAWIPLMAHLDVIDSALVRFGGFECVHIIGGPRAGVVHAWTPSTSSTIASSSPASGLPPEDAKLAFRFQWLPCFIDRIGKRFRSTAFLRLPDFCQRLPFDHVRSLSFGEDRHHDPVPAGCWERLLSSFPAVEELSISGDTPILRTPPTFKTSDGAAQSALQKLSLLSLHAVKRQTQIGRKQRPCHGVLAGANEWTLRWPGRPTRPHGLRGR
ncbi:hypothetical protein FA95DRAFT_823608 [Auriscalpium vulgare]|uniref:Uncharacterized protein n=1 Tax=Auriscalpium vulgare TaxID=40419 RepID=A0ACB8RAY4_9AGAM|nr:hypothetical protein FA95DRAFT_823608 [Auriscalpium vulgare]